jgi:hypothetical protein
MAQFWLATLAIADIKAEEPIKPILPIGTTTLAIEALRDGDGWAVLFSSADDPKNPAVLTCHFGFANTAKACNVWLDRGFPLVDAAIDLDAAGKLTIVSPFFGTATEMQYDAPILTIAGVTIPPPASGAPSSQAGPSKLQPAYRQQVQTPDAAQPHQFMIGNPVTWTPRRSGVKKKLAGPVTLDRGTTPPRCPALDALPSGATNAVAVWTGEIALPTVADADLGQARSRQKFSHAFGTPAFRFQDVEVLGFRINLAEINADAEARLEALVEPLNFHLADAARQPGPSGHTADFRYRAATTTVVIELLRYGRMTSRAPVPPLSKDDCQAQHELLVRLLVGRVDDDTAQARSPSLYVPAIFVDNPWSKVLGRDAVGFDKRLADFCVRDGNGIRPLRPDGRLRQPAQRQQADHPRPLGDIASIHLVDRIGAGPGQPFFELRFPSTAHTDPTALKPIDLDLTFGTSLLAGTRWRQSDFEAGEFRRSFASEAVTSSLTTFRMVQVSPVAKRGEFGSTWITGEFALDPDVRASLPSGIATLILRAVPRDPARPTAPSTPPAWNLLCEILGDRQMAEVVVQSGSWYRLLGSMDLTVDDGLDWSIRRR